MAQLEDRERQLNDKIKEFTAKLRTEQEEVHKLRQEYILLVKEKKFFIVTVIIRDPDHQSSEYNSPPNSQLCSNFVYYMNV